MANTLWVLGSVNADHMLQVPYFPKPGETLAGDHYQLTGGGKGANQAVAAARLKGHVVFVACVGDDAVGHQFCHDFQMDGIDTNRVTAIKDVPTGTALILVNSQGENCIALHPGANSELTPSLIMPWLTELETVHTLLMQLETPIETVTLAAKSAQKQGVNVILNPAPAQPLSDELLAAVDIITPNETEASLLTGVMVNDIDSAKMAADVLHKKGISKVLITMGKAGVLFSHAGEQHYYPGFDVKAVDTTAAGDTFNGALAVALTEGLSMAEAIYLAQAAAAISVTRLGAQSAIPERAEVEQYCKQQKA
ncbi:ribokinase [Zooshikella sp. RANM57]|uniref:ribokinase n=1 Tax=Zooshikella sp. RANM57 TaxID=3425863 RepID=UPI003D6F91CB